MPGNYYTNHQNDRNRNFNQNSNNNQNHTPMMNTSPLELPEDYVDQAENIMRQLMRNSSQKNKLTTSKLRNILSRISDIYNQEIERTEDTLLSESKNNLEMTRVRIAYECGREPAVKNFVEQSKLLNYIKGIKESRKEFIRFARYMEALVAYHRFFGGGDQ